MRKCKNGSREIFPFHIILSNSLVMSREEVMAKYLKRLETYKKIFEIANREEVFEKYGFSLYENLKSKGKIKEKEYKEAIKNLRWELKKYLVEEIEALREEGLGREADKIQENVNENKLIHGFKILRDLKSVKKEMADVDALMNIYLRIFKDMNSLRDVDIDLDEIERKFMSIVPVEKLKTPTKKMTIVNDPTGNAGCLFSFIFRRREIAHTTFSSTGMGDFWITKIEVENGINPNMYTSDISERIVASKGILILEDLNYLILNNKFGEIYRFLYYLKNNYKDRVVVTLNLNALSEKEKARIKGLADEIINLNFPFNICSSHLIFTNDRKKEGALLLSKDFGRNFKGEVFIVADFGGEKSLHPQRIEFEILDKIADALRSGDVVIDAMDILIDENSIEKIYLWLKTVRDIAKKKNGRVYVVVRDLIEEERKYLRPLADIDFFHLSSLENQSIVIYKRELENIESTLHRKVAKECAYNIEMIRRLYSKYPDTFVDLIDEIKKASEVCKKFTGECLKISLPLRIEMENRTRKIDNLTQKFKDKEKILSRRMGIIEEYADTKNIRLCIASAKKKFNAGNMEEAIGEIENCIKKTDKIYEGAMKNVQAIYNNLKCVEYLLPPYFKNKLKKISMKNIEEFARIHGEIKNILVKKVNEEIKNLREYSKLSGIELGNIDEPVKNYNFCEYKKLRDEFMAKFREKENKINEKIRKNIENGIEFLKEVKEDTKNFENSLKKCKDTSSLMALQSRISQNLAQVMRRKLKDYIAKYGYKLDDIKTNIENIMEKTSRNPLENMEAYREIIGEIKRRIKGVGKVGKVEEEIYEYYKILKDYGESFEEKHPHSIEEGEKIIGELKERVKKFNPVMELSVVDWAVDANRDIKIRFRISNRGKSEAQNIIVDITGSMQTDFDIPVLASGNSVDITLESHLEDLRGEIIAEVSCEGIKGDFIYSSFNFKINVKGYTIKKATGTEKCSLCRGKIFKDTVMLVCSKCGAKYHYKCAERSGKCPVCDNIFLFEK